MLFSSSVHLLSLVPDILLFYTRIKLIPPLTIPKNDRSLLLPGKDGERGIDSTSWLSIVILPYALCTHRNKDITCNNLMTVCFVRSGPIFGRSFVLDSHRPRSSVIFLLKRIRRQLPIIVFSLNPTSSSHLLPRKFRSHSVPFWRTSP